MAFGSSVRGLASVFILTIQMSGYVWYGDATLLVMDFKIGRERFHSALATPNGQVAGEITKCGKWVCDVGWLYRW